MSTKDLIQAELEELDEALLADIYLFIKTFIRSKRNDLQSDAALQPAEPGINCLDDDPLSSFIGAVEDGQLASHIDDELYGI